MEFDIEKAEAEVARLNAQIVQERNRLAGMTSIQKEAEAIHNVTCHTNHDDGCGWFYEKWPAPGQPYQRYSTKKKYVDIAIKINSETDFSVAEALRLYKIVRGY